MTAITQATDFLTTTTKAPVASTVVEELLIAEKNTKQQKIRYTYNQLLGTWRLGFITGTKKSQKRAGVILKAGRFLPAIVKIQLTYQQSEANSEQGQVKNSVQVGLLQLVLTGPTQFWQNNILAFDFTQMQITLAGLKLYSGYIRGGQKREEDFYQQKLKDQAFFNYFLVEDDYIAARGKGGGLALWTKVKSS
ncbi:MAG: hypothetical protein WBG73_22215 [Coleofasciculaceae cyanobacterium]